MLAGYRLIRAAPVGGGEARRPSRTPLCHLSAAYVIARSRVSQISRPPSAAKTYTPLSARLSRYVASVSAHVPPTA